ncbi:MAG: HDOD domain-containing protein [Dehalococcoidia bacterium]|nr:HDOD domain-containing protein [Dehalococcoidia bacterium]
MAGSGPGATDAPGQRAGDDPFATARARLVARIARERSARPDVPHLDELLAEVAELQPLPAVARRILQLTEDERFSAHELATVIASDQALTARLLRLANSAYYGASRRIGTVRDAVVLLGFRTVRQVSLASCMLDNPRPLTNLRYEDFWQFSIATGLLAEVQARAEGQHQDVAFTAGVVHNIGLLALDQHRPHLLAEVVTRARQQSETLHQAQRGLMGFADTDLGGALTEHWNFPTPLCNAVREHSRSLDNPPADGTLAALVARARIFARAYGLSDGLAERPDPRPSPEAWATAAMTNSLEREGGMDRILERADAFIAAAMG